MDYLVGLLCDLPDCCARWLDAWITYAFLFSEQNIWKEPGFEISYIFLLHMSSCRENIVLFYSGTRKCEDGLFLYVNVHKYFLYLYTLISNQQGFANGDEYHIAQQKRNESEVNLFCALWFFLLMVAFTHTCSEWKEAIVYES